MRLIALLTRFARSRMPGLEFIAAKTSSSSGSFERHPILRQFQGCRSHSLRPLVGFDFVPVDHGGAEEELGRHGPTEQKRRQSFEEVLDPEFGREGLRALKARPAGGDTLESHLVCAPLVPWCPMARPVPARSRPGAPATAGTTQTDPARGCVATRVPGRRRAPLALPRTQCAPTPAVSSAPKWSITSLRSAAKRCCSGTAPTGSRSAPTPTTRTSSDRSVNHDHLERR